MNKDNKGFGGQWVDIFRTGKHTDSTGKVHVMDVAFLEQVASNFNPEEYEPPAVVGHPKEDAPAYGWACGLRVVKSGTSGMLQAQFCDVDPAFEELVKEGKFKKRSASFYLDANLAPGGRVPALRHVGFLGAQPPAVKGLREIKFNEGEAVTFEPTAFSEGEGMGENEDKKSVGEQIAEFFREKFGLKDDKTQTSFSEAELDARIAKAANALTASFEEKFTAITDENKILKERLDNHSGSATHTEIVSFCERLGAGKFLPAFKNMGVIAFMETLAAMPDKKVGIISFTEKDGKEVETKVEITPLQFFQNFLGALPTYVEFGEKFGDLKMKGDGSELIDPQEMEKLRAGMGTKKTEGGAK